LRARSGSRNVSAAVSAALPGSRARTACPGQQQTLKRVLRQHTLARVLRHPDS
jgi:hypothetical protein